MKTKTLFLSLFTLLASLSAKELHVSMTGLDTNDGHETRPLRSINAAAKIALPGDMVTVHAGTYREWVDPRVGGSSDSQRITYRSAPGEIAVIKGSEVVKGWTQHSGDVWTVTLPESFFGDYNPYRELLFGDWFEDKGRPHHTGEVYLNGQAFYEVETVDKVLKPAPLPKAVDQSGSRFTWFTQSDEKGTTLWANFHGKNPNDELVEINVRQCCFFPRSLGVNYVTVRGFRMAHAATPWAAPTAEQLGLIGPHWSKGWIIEDNVISDSKCVGISLGKERASGENFGMTLKRKSGFQYQLESVFKALQLGWSKEQVGSHIVRNNTIFNCEQAGIVGNLGAAFSRISHNHIYNIWVKRQFDGSEQAGIKFHAPIDTVIEQNRIHDCGLALWMDWQAQGTRITGNLLYGNTKDLMVEVCLGPYLVDNNILLSPWSCDLAAEGGAFVHNLITGKIVIADVLNRATPYHVPHSTTVAGTALVTGGDDRYFNNIFAINQRIELANPKQDTTNPELTKTVNTKKEAFGLAAYNGFNSSWAEYQTALEKTGGFFVSAFSKVKSPVYAGANLHAGGSQVFDGEKGSIANSSFAAEVSVEETPEGVFLILDVDPALAKLETALVTTQSLGSPRIADVPYETPEGKPLQIDTDFLGRKRSGARPTAGPLEGLQAGRQRVRVW